jgi:Thiamine pyrophosphate enzyme, N-terminal TPP binding domain
MGASDTPRNQGVWGGPGPPNSTASRPPHLKGLSGAEAFLRTLRQMGVEQIFASPGSEWAPVWEYLAKPYASPAEIPAYLSTRHEEVAVASRGPGTR